MRGSSHSPVPISWMRRVLTPAAASVCTAAVDGVGAVRNEDRVGLARRLRDALHRPLHLRAVERIAFHRDDAAAAARDRLLERGLHHAAVGVVGDQRRERALALLRSRSR